MKQETDNSTMIYIINLEKDIQRKYRMMVELKSIGWDNYEFIEAVAGDDLPDVDKMIQHGILGKTFIDPNGLLTKNIIACSLSHKKAYATFIKSNHEYAIILEDDVEFSQIGLKMMVAGLLKTVVEDELILNPMIKDTWETFFFGIVGSHIPNNGLVSGCSILHEYKKHSPCWAAHAYLINRRSVDKLIENNTPVRYAADVNIECAHSEIYCSEHSLIHQLAGKYPRHETMRLTDIFTQLLYDRQFYSSTASVLNQNNDIEDFYYNPDKEKPFVSEARKCCVADEIPFKSIEWKDTIDSTGKKVLNWTHIHF
jgi:GR25 family glycosyltransferase involved in LPS biosynthesis